MNSKTYVLAYSGGLDTSVMLKWLQVRHGARVYTLTANLGQDAELHGVEKKARATGAAGVFIADLQEEFVRDFVWPSLRAGALYQGIYPLATALGRPLIAKALVDVARQVGADAVVHGCTGKGNDQVRLEVSVGALAPGLKCLAPLRDWELKTREDEIAWAQNHGIPVLATRATPYSIDENLWGLAVEAGSLEDPWESPPDDCWQITTDPRQAPAQAEDVVIGFDAGLPVSLDGQLLSGVELIHTLNRRAAAHGVGRIDMVEDRLVGIKSREVYEAPAAVTLHAAREALEQITLDRETRRLKAQLGQEFARLIYDGLWYTPVRESIQAFVQQACQPVTGEVRLSLHRGLATATGRRSQRSLYHHHLATYGQGDAFRHNSAAGFIDIFGLAPRTAAAAARDSAAAAVHGQGTAPQEPGTEMEAGGAALPAREAR